MEDRFGPPPKSAKALVRLMRTKPALRHLRALSAEGGASRIALKLADDTPLPVSAVQKLLANSRGNYGLTPSGRLSRKLGVGERPGTLRLLERMLAELKACLDEASQAFQASRREGR